MTNRLWSTRTTSSGRFEKAKRDGDLLRGSRRADRDRFDAVYGLAFLAILEGVALFLHSMGVFCH